MRADKWPINYDALTKGQVIPATELERILGVRREADLDKYRLKVLSLKETIMREMEGRGMPVVIRSERDDLRILTDGDASRYTPKLYKQHLRGMFRSHNMAQHIDVAMLDDKETTEHTRHLEVQGRVLQSVVAERKAIRSDGAKRTTPGKERLLEDKADLEVIRQRMNEPSTPFKGAFG